MTMFLLSAAFWGAALIRGRRLLVGGTYFDLSVNGEVLIRGWCLYEDQHLLEELQ